MGAATALEAEPGAPAELVADPAPGADAGPGADAVELGLEFELELEPVLALPELAPGPGPPGRDGVLTDGEDGTPWVPDTAGGAGAGTGDVGTGGVGTGGAGTGGVETGGVGTGGVVTVGTASLPAAPAAGAETSRPEIAAARERIFRDMIACKPYLEENLPKPYLTSSKPA
ncbi:MAG: hypothetical protein WCB67_01815 [Solirubrobacteraceae bacterium]